MSLRKQVYRFYIAFSLLLGFSATQFPFELFHSHNNSNSCIDNSTKDGICNHKIHIGKQERFCWACIIHLDKTFDLPSNIAISAAIPCNNNIAITHFSIHNSGYHFIALRGPPFFII